MKSALFLLLQNVNYFRNDKFCDFFCVYNGMRLNLPNEECMLAHKDELQWWKFMLTLPAITCLIKIFVLICMVKTEEQT